jgi:hypothetical protein
VRNFIGAAQKSDLVGAVRKLAPGYMPMGSSGMSMGEMAMPAPATPHTTRYTFATFAAMKLYARGSVKAAKITAADLLDVVGPNRRATKTIRLRSPPRQATASAAGDSVPGSIVELRRFEDAARRSQLAVPSDLSIDTQVKAQGATWLDRLRCKGTDRPV